MSSGASKAATAPTNFPELQQMSTEQLSELLSDREKFQALLKGYVNKSQPVHVIFSRPISHSDRRVALPDPEDCSYQTPLLRESQRMQE